MESDEAKAIRAELLKSIDGEKLESLIREKEEKFHGLLTREAALFAVSKELNIGPPQKPVSVSQLTPQTKRATVFGRIIRIFDVKRFEKNGKQGRVCRVFLGDESGERPLVLWNDDVDYVERGKILNGDMVEVRGAYMKGGEIALGYGGSIAVLERKPEKKITDMSEGDGVSLTAAVSEYSGLRRYEREGTTHEMGSCMLEEAGGKIRLVLWEPHERALEGARPGDSVRIEGARLKNGEIQTGRFSKIILIKKPITPGQLTSDFEGEVEGKIEGIVASAEGLSLTLEEGGEAEFILPKNLALKLLGLKSLPEDVSLDTMLKLKGNALVGSSLKAGGKAGPEEGKIVFKVHKLIS